MRRSSALTPTLILTLIVLSLLPGTARAQVGSATDIITGQITNQDGPIPGASERAFNDAQLSRMPTDASDLALLASLVPGVVSLAGSDSTANSFSVAGLGSEANAVTLDGLLFGSSSVPQEGLRNT